MSADSVEWRIIPGFDDAYEVSSAGIIRRIKQSPGRTYAGKLMAETTDRQGYVRVMLTAGCRNAKYYSVHRLVMLAFVGASNLQVNHKNGVKSDNRVENLEYVTPSENVLHAYHVLKNHNTARGARIASSKLTDEKVRSIRHLYAEGITKTELAKIFSVSRGCIIFVVKRETWIHVE